MFPALEALKEFGGSVRRGEVISTAANREGLSGKQLASRYETTGFSVAADSSATALGDVSRRVRTANPAAAA